nr:alpha-1,4-glucan--maltose-1-phosphate maltosyltransferase [Chloroflexota bacterium]
MSGRSPLASAARRSPEDSITAREARTRTTSGERDGAGERAGARERDGAREHDRARRGARQARDDDSAVTPEDGRRRVVIEGAAPEIDGGRFPAKRTVGQEMRVEVDAFLDGHDLLSCVLRWRREAEPSWAEVPMKPLGNDRWYATFPLADLGPYRYTFEGWVDHFGTWQHDLGKRVAAGQDVAVPLLVGAQLVEEAAERATGPDASALRGWAEALRVQEAPTTPPESAAASRRTSAASRPAAAATGEAAAPSPESERVRGRPDERISLALSDRLADTVARYPDRRFATRYDRELAVVADPVVARFSTWYELFPRSAAREPGRHGTFADVEAQLPEIAAMGFDVLYLPPIHPIGRTHRKGPNNAVTAGTDDPGSPWAIGAEEGGHRAIHPELGSMDDFRHLVRSARAQGIELALDIAFQSSPDHPAVREHPEWFRWRPDGTVQYAENPPKKYQDIYPFDFEIGAWRSLWEELRDTVLHWVEQGVYVFRVDNPHTKPFPFWEWLIDEVRHAHPQVIFLAEAFTRPKVMYRLGKLGFSQSYTYFAWRTAKWELTEYFTELTGAPVRDFYRPNVWPNTPDILTEQLQIGGPPAFMIRLVLAATLAASYGIYGPAFETFENQPRDPGSEEYLDSEKYQIHHWDMSSRPNLREFISRVNRIRHEQPALQWNEGLRFHATDNEQLICYSKRSPD